jgi:hypothetical protein
LSGPAAALECQEKDAGGGRTHGFETKETNCGRCNPLKTACLRRNTPSPGWQKAAAAETEGAWREGGFLAVVHIVKWRREKSKKSFRNLSE